MKYVIAIDQGTSGTTILLVNQNGETVYKYYQSFSQSYPQPGWVEHDPELIWETVRQGLIEILALPWLDRNGVKAIGITNQRETIVVWEKETGKPVYPAIVWQCRRTAERCTELLNNGTDKVIQGKTGLPVDPYFSATKLEWIFNTFPKIRARAEQGELAGGTIDAWLVWKLTGGKQHVTDYSNASRTMLFNIYTLNWDAELLKIFNIPPGILPEAKPSLGIFGTLDPAVIPGLEIPIAGILGDQQAALLGQGCLEAGEMKNTYGTGCFLLMNTGEKPSPPVNGLITTIAWGAGSKVSYALEGSVFMAGAIVQWLRDDLELIREAKETEVLARQVPDTNGVYFVPAFTGLGAPHWDPYARGSISGLTRGVKRNHLVRAALEGIAYQVGEVVDSMSEATGERPRVLRVDGGAAANNFLMQFQADICDLTIQRSASLEVTGLGAAFGAGLGAGLWGNLAEIKELLTPERDFTAQMSQADREKLWSGWRKAIDRSRNWARNQ